MKTTLKRIGLSIATVSVLSTSSYGFSILGTSVDEATLEMQIIQQVELVATAKQTYDQLNQTYKEWDELTKLNIKETFSNKLKELIWTLADNNLDIFDLDLDNPKSQIGAYAKQLFESYTLFDDCAYDYLNDDQKRICKNKMVRSVHEIATFSMLKDSLNADFEKISQLGERLTKSDDAKETADIAAAIQAQMAQMQAKKLQIEMMLANNKANERMEQRQKEQMYQQKDKVTSTW